MKERKPEELDHYRDVAQLAVAQHATDMKRSEMNQHAKRALEMLRKDVDTADDDALADFAANMAVMSATLQSLTLKSANEILERIFNNSSLIVAHLLGVYDLEDDSPLPTYSTILEGVKDRQAKRQAAKRSEDVAKPPAADDWWEQQLSRQYM